MAGRDVWNMLQDKNGYIWFSRIDKSIWFVENDTVKSWEYNHLIEQYKKEFILITQLAVDTSQNVWIDAMVLGTILVDKNGNHRVLRESPNFNFHFRKIGDQLFDSWQSNNRKVYLNPVGNEPADIYTWEDGVHVKVKEVEKKITDTDSYLTAWEYRDDTVLLAYGGKIDVVKGSKILYSFQSDILQPKIRVSKKGEIYVANSKSKYPGLLLFSSLSHFQKNEREVLIDHVPVTDILLDHEGGIWATVVGKGLWYCKNASIDVLNSSIGFDTDNIMNITSDGGQTVYAATESAIYMINGELRMIEHHIPASNAVTTLHYDPQKKRVWYGGRLSDLNHYEFEQVFWQDPDFNVPRPVHAKKISVSPSGERLWMSSSNGFYNYDYTTSSINYFDRQNRVEISERTFSVLEDRQGRIWVATIDGLRIWQNDHYMMVPFQDPALKYQVKDMILLQDGSIAFGFANAGILVYKPDGSRHRITVRDGLSSDFISTLKAGAHNYFYACTDEGLNKIYENDEGRWMVQNAGQSQGLPSSIVHDVTEFKDMIWVATEEGIAIMDALPEKTPIPAPRIESLKAGPLLWSAQNQLRIPFRYNSISIRFQSLHLSSEGDIAYRFRMNSADTVYQYARAREVNFPGLSPGHYQFEVQSRQHDGTWSIPTVSAFDIMTPWWMTWWFRGFILVSVAILFAWLYNLRLISNKKKDTFQKKLRDMELAALRAQMNPHFIFNCLGSIQHFIADNDKASATRYLSRFARLVRLSLHSSVDGKHTLAEEIAMLDNYLALEQMRFRGKFIYEIKLEGIDDPNEIILPPMLIQPFVENAG